MALNMDIVGAKYLLAFIDTDGDFLNGRQSYVLHVPKDIPVALFWSVTVYDPITGSGLDNGQPFPSLNTMDKPVMNDDGSMDLFFSPQSPGAGKNWLATIPGKGWFTIFCLYGPKQSFFAPVCRQLAQNPTVRLSKTVLIAIRHDVCSVPNL